jgi:hypothetical protein
VNCVHWEKNGCIYTYVMLEHGSATPRQQQILSTRYFVVEPSFDNHDIWCCFRCFCIENCESASVSFITRVWALLCQRDLLKEFSRTLIMWNLTEICLHITNLAKVEQTISDITVISTSVHAFLRSRYHGYPVCCECCVFSGREVSETGRLLVRRSPTVSDVSECDLETSTMRRTR